MVGDAAKVGLKSYTYFCCLPRNQGGAIKGGITGELSISFPPFCRATLGVAQTAVNQTYPHSNSKKSSFKSPTTLSRLRWWSPPKQAAIALTDHEKFMTVKYTTASSGSGSSGVIYPKYKNIKKDHEAKLLPTKTRAKCLRTYTWVCVCVYVTASQGALDWKCMNRKTLKEKVFFFFILFFFRRNVSSFI